MSTRSTKAESKAGKDLAAKEAPGKDGTSNEKPAARPRRARTTGVLIPVQSFCADEVALLAATVRRAESAPSRCDACDVLIEGEPHGRGLFVWSRGGEIAIEEPTLCEHCGSVFGVVMNRRWDIEEEEG